MRNGNSAKQRRQSSEVVKIVPGKESSSDTPPVERVSEVQHVDAAAERDLLRNIVSLQGEKINSLIERAELDGAHLRKEIAGLKREISLLEAELGIAREDLQLQARHYAHARAWQQHFISRLGPTLEIANHQVDVYESGWNALKAPSHRLISFVMQASGLRTLKRSVAKLRTFARVVRSV